MAIVFCISYALLLASSLCTTQGVDNGVDSVGNTENGMQAYVAERSTVLAVIFRLILYLSLIHI